MPLGLENAYGLFGLQELLAQRRQQQIEDEARVYKRQQDTIAQQERAREFGLREKEAAFRMREQPSETLQRMRLDLITPHAVDEPTGLEPDEQASFGVLHTPQQTRTGLEALMDTEGRLKTTGRARLAALAINPQLIEPEKAPTEEKRSPAYQEYLDARKEGYQKSFEAYQTDDANRKRLAAPRPQVSIIATPDGMARVDRLTGQVMPLESPTGGQLPLSPTAEMRNKAQTRGFVGESVKAVQDLSERIVTKVGPMQRATAAVRGTEAVFGNDPEFRTYQDARTALAGNLAVLQQGSRPSDADIKAIWLPLVPDAYRDTRESAAMKWKLIHAMSNLTPKATPESARPSVDDLIREALGQ